MQTWIWLQSSSTELMPQIQRGDALQMNSLSSHFAFCVASNPIFIRDGVWLAGINPCLQKLLDVLFFCFKDTSAEGLAFFFLFR